MSRSIRFTTIVTILGGAAMLHAAQGQDVVAQRFKERVDQYATLRGAIESQLPLHVSSEGSEIGAMVDDLAAAIRLARPGARLGDFFDAGTARLFRDRIQETLLAHYYHVADLLNEISSEAPRLDPPLTVKGDFDWRFGAMMPAAIIGVLPELPEAVQYRFIGRDLVLVDTDTGLILDVLKHALPSR
jgi:hypothetical protein